MFIESLTIRKNGKKGTIIRKINFQLGVNLIIDRSSPDHSKTETGNNVGKTTVLRLIDFCLGAKKEKIYQDREFKGRNEELNNVKKFLIENEVYIELMLTNNLTNTDSKKITIGRNFLNHKLRIQEINSKQIGNDYFTKKLAELIFNHQLDKPSFRQMICRNIRHESAALNKTVKPLDYVSNAEYEAIYLYWLGIYSDSNKYEVTHNLKSEENYYKQTERSQGVNLNTIKQKILTYNREIKLLNKKKEKFNLNENYSNDLKQLNQTKEAINELKTQIVSLTLKKSLIIESQSELDKTSPNVDEKIVQSIYSEAKVLLPYLQKRFEEVLVFHNNMIEEKKRFIGHELPQIDNALARYEKHKQELLQEEVNLSKKLQKTGALEELESLIQQLTQQHEEKGRLEKLKELLEKSKNKIDKWKDDLQEINKRLKNENDQIEERISKFNTYFGEFSKQLYDKPFVLSHEFNEHNGQTNLKLSITGLEENPGTGGKRGEIIAFDLAYIQFAKNLDIPHMNFVLHDQIENIHDNQISAILLNEVQKIHCQYIVPVLQDKLPSDINPSQYSVLSLSQDDKLFKIQ